MCAMLNRVKCQAAVLRLAQDYCDTHNKSLRVSESTDLIDEIGLTSLDVMELIESLEDEFDIALPINDLAEVRTVGDLVEVAVKAA